MVFGSLRALLPIIVLVLAGASWLTAQVSSAQVSPAPELPVAQELVRAAVANEVTAANDSSVKHMFRSWKKTPHGSQTRIYVETKDAMAGMTIASDDKPLSEEQVQAERGRLAGLVSNPELLRRKQRQEKEEAEHTLRIVKALPDALLFDYDGSLIGSPTLGSEGTQLVRLRFRPNPAYRPPSHVEDVLVGMKGVVLVDATSRRIAQIDGTLFKEVTFGWGILGHLDKGGHFLVEQREVGDGSWDISRMSLSFTGKILLFKSLTIKSEEVFSDFRRVPADTTFAQGVKMLEAEETRLAENQKPGATADPKSH